MICKVRKGTIHYEVCGEGVPLLILHSMGTDYRSMKMWMEPIFSSIQGFKRYYIDLPAHGLSKIDESLKSTDDMLNNILEFIEKKVSNQFFHLVGFSFGGYLAQGILHYKRKQVRGLCLLASALHLKEKALPKKVVYEKDEVLLNTLNPDIREAFETLMIIQNEENLKRFLSELQPGRLLANREVLTSSWREKEYFLSEVPFHDVESLPQSALIILGKQDFICGYKDHEFLINIFPNSTFVILDRAGHMLQIEKREVIQVLIKDWLIGL
ncbi:alpha/beta fold hydrolase [Caldalkalibacillus mannanilyticus]|uniref:alpha/beta fold hydrolase n=1 Tax=Caldalkalibacillus mannanilyticus TaxID=1418 RepID=UPI000469210C|nr:alpha/beta hydrolase [Caldalkalibacillus mannanilyticus]